MVSLKSPHGKAIFGGYVLVEGKVSQSTQIGKASRSGAEESITFENKRFQLD
jgi:hypothetical protein